MIYNFYLYIMQFLIFNPSHSEFGNNCTLYNYNTIISCIKVVLYTTFTPRPFPKVPLPFPASISPARRCGRQLRAWPVPEPFVPVLHRFFGSSSPVQVCSVLSPFALCVGWCGGRRTQSRGLCRSMGCFVGFVPLV